MSPRRRTPEDAILRTTVELIAEHGVSGVTVDTVAARAGVGKATIYRRWGSRARLIHAAIQDVQRPLVEPDTGSLRDDLVLLLRQLVAYLDRHDGGRVFTSFIDAAARDPELGMLRRETEQQGRAVYARVIQRGIERGELQVGVDVELLTDMLIAPFVYRRVLAQSAVRRDDVGPVVDAVLGASSRVPT